MFQHPVQAILTPKPSSDVPEGFQRKFFELDRAMPTEIVIEEIDWSVLLYASTGRVGYWLRIKDGVTIMSSETQSTILPDADENLADPISPVLVFSDKRNVQARIPLIVHSPQILPMIGEKPGHSIELIILGFNLVSEAMRGPKAGNSWIDLAWRRIDLGTDIFMAPIARRKLRTQTKFTQQSDRAPKKANAEYYSDETEAATRGGMNWRLTHD